MLSEKEHKALLYLERLKENLCKYDCYKDFKIDFDYQFPSLPIQVIPPIAKINNPCEKRPRDFSYIYRARQNEKFIKEKSTMKLPFKIVDEISVINKTEDFRKINFGRCNKNFEPRFYASNDFGTACYEAITKGLLQEDSEAAVTVGVWKIIEPLNLAKINYSENAINEIKNIDEVGFNPILESAIKSNQNQLEYAIKDGYGSVEFVTKLLNFLYGEFSKMQVDSENDYYVTNIFCDHVFNHVKEVQVDGVLYPSSRMSYQTMNLVLHPRAIKKIKFVSAMMVWVTYFEKSGNTNFIPLEQNVLANNQGELQWQKFKW